MVLETKTGFPAGVKSLRKEWELLLEGPYLCPGGPMDRFEEKIEMVGISGEAQFGEERAGYVLSSREELAQVGFVKEEVGIKAAEKKMEGTTSSLSTTSDTERTEMAHGCS